jgi:hypothetical protein
MKYVRDYIIGLIGFIMSPFILLFELIRWIVNKLK